MDAIGIVVEYNPLHNGHLRHLEQIQQQFPQAPIIAIMSGNFLQRGIPAVLSKWQRTTLALAYGVDIVIELPYAHAVQRADIFASGALARLDALNVSHLVFGSESGDVGALQKSIEQPTQANDILGFYYLQAIKQLGSRITPIAIKRQHSDYNQGSMSHATIASATAIRTAMLANESIEQYVPDQTAALLSTQESITLAAYYPYIRHHILTNFAGLAEIALVAEGIEHRLYEAAVVATTYEQWRDLVETSRYRKSHLNRLATHILTHTTWHDLDAAVATLDYIRVLGFSNRGQQYLKLQREQVAVPIITSLANNTSIHAQLELNATRSYALLFQNQNIQAQLALEYNKKPILGGKRNE